MRDGVAQVGEECETAFAAARMERESGYENNGSRGDDIAVVRHI